jgi:hypothetical protein
LCCARVLRLHNEVERSAWIVDYFDQTGKRRLKTFATKKAADAWAITALHEVKQGTHTPSSTSVTVSEATERWIASRGSSKLFAARKAFQNHVAACRTKSAVTE